VNKHTDPTYNEDEDLELIYSPLSRSLSEDGHTLRIEIYGGAGEPGWILEIEDERGTSTVWSEPFDTEQAALDEALAAIAEEGGIGPFCRLAQQEAKDAEPELLAKLEAQGPTPSAALPSPQQLMQPLSDAELEELGHFLVHDMPIEVDSMTLEMLDGYLHALAIGPETVMPSRWLPQVWGQEDEGYMLPPVESQEQAQHLLGLVMRHFNSIIHRLEQHPNSLEPIFGTDVSDEGEYEDAGMWAHGFMEGVKLSLAAWQPLLSSKQGARWYRPLQLLGDDDCLDAGIEATATKAQVLALNQQVVDSVLAMHAHWLPLRQAVAQRQTAQRLSTKVGRNEPCPCGSGKKFKKCCGAPAELH
jgi:uncharacterized protein